MSDAGMPVTVLVLLGSLRRASINRGLVTVALDHAPEGVRMAFFDRLSELPHYNEDIDNGCVPNAVAALRDLASEADAVLVVTPEYNGTIPGVLKNAIDWLSRPYGLSPVKDKYTAVIGASLGRYGGSSARDDTRKAFAITGSRIANTLAMSVSTSALNGKDPSEHPTIVERVSAIVRDLSVAARC